tara:strand:- start:3898 stop:4872 length:975 start_codon:yes stop_codon:yes gene_type:complete
MKVKDAINDLKSGLLKPIYFLKGGDQFLQSFFIDKISRYFFNDQPENKYFLVPDEIKGKEIIDRLTITDLFATKTLFILKNPQQLKGKVNDDLLEYCKFPNENNILVLTNDDWTKKAAFLTQIEKLLDPIDVQTPFSSKLKKWANYFFKERQKSVHPTIINITVEMAGDSLMHLQNEIDKICLWVGDRDDITLNDIEKFSGWKREYQRWEFLLAFGEKDYERTLSLGKTIITSNDSMISLIYPLTAMFQEMLYVKMKNGTFTDSRSYMPIPPSVKKKIPQFSKGFSRKKLEFALNQLGQIDKRKKTTISSDETELIQFIGHVIG